MFQRSLRVLLICGLTLAGAASSVSAQQAETLMFHKRPVGNGTWGVHQLAVMLPLPPTPAENPAPPSSSTYDQVAVEVALQWMVEHSYLDQVPTAGVDVTVAGSSTTVTWTGPGIHIVIVLPNGPFLPKPWPNRLMTATVVLDISNGF